MPVSTQRAAMPLVAPAFSLKRTRLGEGEGRRPAAPPFRSLGKRAEGYGCDGSR